MLRVAFRRFYPGFNPTEFWIPLIERATDSAVVRSSERTADVVFTSVFESFHELWKRRLLSNLTVPSVPRRSKKAHKHATQIWISGENIRPPLEGFDLSLSFDIDPYGNTNVYFPLILEYLDWGFSSCGSSEIPLTSRGAPMPTPASASKVREHDVSARPKFACAFIGNAEPVRMRAIQALRKYAPVDVFGTAVGRPIASKSAVASEYRFVLAFENDIYPGYVTEKPLEAYSCGAIPLWRGLDAYGLLNSEALINAASHSSLEDFASEVAAIDQDACQLNQMASRPLFSSTPTIEPAIQAMRATLCL